MEVSAEAEDIDDVKGIATRQLGGKIVCRPEGIASNEARNVKRMVARTLPLLRAGDQSNVVGWMKLHRRPLEERRVLDAGKEHSAAVDRCAQQTATQVQFLDRGEEGGAELDELAISSGGQ